MTEYLTEQEQIQQLKSWVKEYGLTILLGIIVALGITSGWQYWQNYHIKILSHASAVYDEMLTLRAQNNTEGSHLQANKLITHYPKTPYADMAALLLARDAVLQKDYATALQQLNWVDKNSKNPPIRQIAEIRIARILIAEEKPNEALQRLKQAIDKNFIGMIDEVRGDAYLAQNQLNAARNAYQMALQELPNAEVTRPILVMKLDNLTA